MIKQSNFAGALDIQRNLDDRHAAAHTLNGWGDVARVRGSFDLARDRCVESLARFREVNDRRGEAYALESLGQVASDQGDGGAARPLFEESLTIFRDLDNPQGAANVLTDLALLGIRERDITTAASLAQEALERFERCGDAAGRGDALYALGRATAGAELLLDSLRLRVQVGDRRGIAECLETLGTVACARSQYTWAARLWGLA